MCIIKILGTLGETAVLLFMYVRSGYRYSFTFFLLVKRMVSKIAVLLCMYHLLMTAVLLFTYYNTDMNIVLLFVCRLFVWLQCWCAKKGCWCRVIVWWKEAVAMAHLVFFFLLERFCYRSVIDTGCWYSLFVGNNRRPTTNTTWTPRKEYVFQKLSGTYEELLLIMGFLEGTNFLLRWLSVWKGARKINKKKKEKVKVMP